ncbi:MAG: S-layer homology domain-containing protein [Chloroflexi bacterium]|nr:S-layer homology domain-containing protein [Chloroflexota bacterium]
MSRPPLLAPTDLYSLDLQVDGVDDYASAPDSNSLDVGTGAVDDFTLETFFYVPDLTNTSTDTLFWKNGAYGLYILYYTTQADRFIFRINTDPTNYVYMFYSVDLGTGWHHVAAVFDNEFTASQDLMGIYLDGNLAGSSTAAEWTPGLLNSSSALNLGGYSGINSLNGWMEETRISNSVRYSGSTYTVPTTPFASDGNTNALWHFDDGWDATTFSDGSGNGNTLTGQNGAKIGNPTGTPPPPSTFGKSAPINGATHQSISPTLSWEISSGAASYEYCYDTSDNTTCDASWISTPDVFADLPALEDATTYYWQVHAINPGGTTAADSGNWWSFTTGGVPSVIFVNEDASGGNNGSSWEDAFIDLQDALAIAQPGDQIWVAAGTYKPTNGTERGSSFALRNGVALYGGFAGTEIQFEERDWVANETILSGDLNGDDVGFANNADNSYHVVWADGVDSSAILNGFTVTAGNASDPYSYGGGGMVNLLSSPTLTNLNFISNTSYGGSGGMHNIESSPTLVDVLFSGNTATREGAEGGGMGNYWGSSPSLTNVAFIGNSASYGGGMRNLNESSPTLTNVSFIDNTAAAGGGIKNTRSHPILINVTFSGNTASWAGGGIFNGESNPILTNVTFSNNTAVQGGGLINIMSSSPSLTYVTFNENTATETGGGMYSENNSNPTLTNVTFSANEAGSGGGMYNQSSPIVKNVLFSDNGAAENGGGMYNLGGAPVLTNVVFSGNTAAAGGGGIYNDGSNPMLTNVTFNSNSAGVEGGGIFNEYSSPTIDNVILWGNESEIYNLEGAPTIANSVVQGGCPSGAACTNIITSDPFFVDSANGNLHLLAGSSAIDNGNDAVVPPGVTTDLDGNPRFIYTVDIGAYEYQGTEPLPFSKVAPANGAGSQSLNPTLSWDASARAAGYEYCYYSTNPSDCAGPWTSTNGATFAAINGLDTSTTYFWQVRAVNPSGNTNADNGTWWAFTTLSNPPGAFDKSSPVNGALDQPTSLTITWTASAGADRYEYCLDTTDDDTCSPWVDNGSATTKLLSGLSPASTYYWHVRAVNTGGTTYSNVGVSAYWSFTTVPNAPTAFTKLSPQNGAQAQPTSLTLTWAPSEGAASYEYCYDTSDDDACAPWVDNGLATSVDLSNLTSGDTYYWQVRAVNTGGSAYANAGAWWSYTIMSDMPIFTDIPVNYWARPFIERLYLAGVTGGCSSLPLRYCPNTNVNRAMMAVFVLRAARGLGFTPPPATGTVFADVPADSFAAAWIEELAAEGITGGCGGGNYCPTKPVTRAMMAVFLVKAMYGVGYNPPEATGTVFLDIPQDGFAAAFIEKLAADGVTGGCGGGNYCPNNYITRAEMAVFLVAAFDLP